MDTNGQLTNDTQVKYIAKVGAQNWAVNEETGRIQFLDSRFYPVGQDDFVPSSTTITSEAYPKGPGYYEWLKKHGQDSDEIRDEAGRRGSVVHNMSEILDRGGSVDLMTEDGEPKFKLLEWAMIGRYMDFRKRFPAEIYAIELKMASKELGYGGTLDRVMRIGGILYLIDIKTSKEVWPHHWLQTASYHRLLIKTGMIAKVIPETLIGEDLHLAILHLNSKHKTNGKGDAMQGVGWQFVTQEKPTAHYFSLFEKTRALWMEEHASELPKTTSYQLSYTLK